VGDQPVLIFWGYLADAPSPQRGVIDRMIAESRSPRQPSPEAARPSVVETPRAEEPPSVAPPPLPTTRYRWLPLLLWLVFTALCLVIGLDLLYACGMGLPWQASVRPLLIDYCPAAMATTEPSKLGELESQNQILQGQLDRLLGAITARRQQCAEAAGGGRRPRPISDVPTPVPVPTTGLPVASETPPPLPVDTPSAPPVAIDTPMQILPVFGEHAVPTVPGSSVYQPPVERSSGRTLVSFGYAAERSSTTQACGGHSKLSNKWACRLCCPRIK
jgi:hypothetical protein